MSPPVESDASYAGSAGFDLPADLDSSTVWELVKDICATIPTYYRPLRRHVDRSVRGQPPPMGTLYWFLWVLEVVGTMKEATPELTVWIVQCFDWIYECTGLVKARLVANRLNIGHRGPILP